MKTSARFRAHSAGQGRFVRSLSTALPPWLVICVALAIGLGAAVGINQIDEQERQASDAELIVTQIQMQSASALNVYGQYLRTPEQSIQLSAQYQAIQETAQSLLLSSGRWRQVQHSPRSPQRSLKCRSRRFPRQLLTQGFLTIHTSTK